MTVYDQRIPAIISEKLQQVLRRFRRVLLWKGLTITLTAFLASMLLGIALDRFFLMPEMFRYAISAVALGLTLAAAWRYWLRPTLRQPDSVSLAATVEEEHPELQERVSATVEFAISDTPVEMRGSQEMIDAVTEQARISVGRVNFADAVSAERARTSTATAVFLVLVTGLVAALWWGQFSQLVHRFAMPWANIARVSDTKIEIEPGDRVVPVGTPVNISAEVTPTRVGEATLYLEEADDDFKPYPMTRAERGVFGFHIFGAKRTMRYYVRAGDAITRRYTITAVEPPKRLNTDIRYEYPAYTKLETVEVKHADGDVRGIVGTRVTLTLTVNKSVARAYLDLPGDDIALAEVSPQTYQASFVLAKNDNYVPRFVDEYGYDNHNEESRQIIATPDRKPKVVITAPERNVKRHGAATEPVSITVEDDFGVSAMSLVFRVNEDKASLAELPIAFSPVGGTPVDDTYRWNLRTIKPRLKPGDIVYYRVKALDNRPGSPNEGWSSQAEYPHSILITAPEYAIDKNIRQEMIQKIKKQMEALRQELLGAKKQVDHMKQWADKKGELAEWQDRSKQTAKGHLDNAEPKAKELKEMLEKDPMMDRMAGKAQEIEEKNVPEAKKATGEVDERKMLEMSRKPIEKAKAEIDDALRKLDEMAKELRELEKKEEEERKLADMAGKEQKIADQAEKADENKLKDLADQQKNLEDQLKDMMDDKAQPEAVAENLEDMKNLREDIQDLINKEKELKKDTEEARKRKLEELEKRQEELNRKADAAKPDVQPKLDERKAGEMPKKEMEKALDAMKKDELAKAVDEQKQAEDKMRKQADQLEKPADEQGKPEAKPQPKDAEKMRDMANEQEKIRRELAQLAGLPQMDKKMEDIVRKQEQLKQEAQALNQEAQPKADPKEARGEKAPEEMQKAVDAMKQQQPRKAPEKQEEAAKDLDQLAKNLEKQAGKRPEDAKPEEKPMAEKAKDLAKRQRELKKELEAALPEANPEMEKLAERQEELEQEAQDLAKQLEEVADAAAQMVPEAAKAAKKADEAMKRAPKHMDKAQKKLEEAAADQAKAEEQNAIDAMQEAEAEAGKMEEQLAQAMENMEGQAEEAGQPENGQPENGPPTNEMAKALGQMQRAEEAMRGGKPEQGQQHAERAAQALSRAAQQSMKQGKPHPKGMPTQTKKPKEGNRMFKDAEALRDLKPADFTDEDWAKLPGELKAQLIQSMKGKYPEEYRQVIRDYFKRLAMTSGTN